MRSVRIGYSSLCAVILLCTAGCLANANSIYREVLLNGENGTASISLDAKQRVVLTGRSGQNFVACAEPSPDALSVIGSSLAAKGYTPSQISVELAGTSSENASNIGLRTQSIQLLRDAMYRLCEAYLGGALDKTGYVRLQRRYQNAMLGLLAIEQLTGAVVPKQVVLTTTNVAEISNRLIDGQKKVDEAKDKLVKANEQLSNAVSQKKTIDAAVKAKEATARKDQEVASGEGATDDDKTKAKASAASLAQAEKNQADLAHEIEVHERAVKDAEENLTNQEALRDMARVHAQSGGAGQFTPSVGVNNVNNNTVGALGEAVRAIVSEIVNTKLSEEACLEAQIDNDDIDFDKDRGRFKGSKSSSSALRWLQSNSVEKFCSKLLALKGEEATAKMKGTTIPPDSAQEIAAQEIQLKKLENQLRVESLNKELQKIRNEQPINVDPKAPSPETVKPGTTN